MPTGMRRTAKLALVCLAVAGMAFFLLPLVPKTVNTYELFAQHGGCYNGISGPTHIYASISYSLFQYGEVYIPVGSLWWLASNAHPECV
jgi:hypothetical protein